MEPEMASENEILIVKKLLPHINLKLNLRRSRSHDTRNFHKIKIYYHKKGNITKKQYRAFRHYCKKYEVKLDNSIQFMLED